MKRGQKVLLTDGAGDRNRTDTPLGNGFLRPARLPVPPHPHLGFCSGEKGIPQQILHSALTIHFFTLDLDLPFCFLGGFGFITLIAAASNVFLMCDA